MGGLCSLPTPISPLLLITSPWRRGQEQSLPGSPGIPLAGRRKARFLDLTSLWANRMISTPAFCAVCVNFCEHWPVLGWLPEQSLPLVRRPCECNLLISPSKASTTSFSFGIRLLSTPGCCRDTQSFLNGSHLFLYLRRQAHGSLSFDNFH